MPINRKLCPSITLLKHISPFRGIVVVVSIVEGNYYPIKIPWYYNSYHNPERINLPEHAHNYAHKHAHSLENNQSLNPDLICKALLEIYTL